MFVMWLAGIVFALNAIVSLWVFHFLQKSRTQYQEAAATASQNMAHLLQNSISDTFNMIDLGLQVVSQEVARQIASGGIDAGSLNAYLGRLRSHMPELDGLRIANADGIISHDTDIFLAREININDQWYFQYLRDHPGVGAIVSDLHVGHVSRKWGLIIARRLQNSDGTFAGVAIGAISPHRFTELFSSLDIGSKGTVNLRDDNLRIMLRYSPSSEAMNDEQEALVSDDLRESIRVNATMGTYAAQVPYDDVKRIISYRRIEGWQMYVLVGVAEVDYLADWHREVAYNVAMALFFLLISLLVAWLLYRYWKSRRILMEDLDRQQKKFRSLASMSSDWFWEQDSQFRFTNISRNPAHWSEAAVDSLIGKRLWELESWHASRSEKAREALAAHQKMMEEHRPFEDFEYCLRDEEGREHTLSICGEPVFDEQGAFIGYQGVAKDITSRKEAEERERLLSNMYRALSATNEAIIHVESSQALFPLVCRIAVGFGGMALSWLGIPDPSGRFIPIASYGKAIGYLDDVVIMSTPDRAEGQGPSGVAFRENRTVVFHDIKTDKPAAPWRDKAQQYGLRAAAAFPILRNGRPYAIWAVYSDRAGAFNEEIIKLLNELAANVSFALLNIEREERRHQDEIALRNSQERFRTLFENAGDGIVIGDMKGKILDANARAAEMLGYSREEMLAMKVVDILAEHDRVRVPENWEGWKTGNNAISDWTFRRKDGSNFEGEVNSQLLPDGRVMGIMRDITERKKVEEDLKLAAMVYQDSNEAMMVTSSDNRILAVNPAFERITGYRVDEVIGQSANILFAGMHDAEFYKSIDRAVTEKGYWKGELWSLRKNRQPFAIFITINTSYSLEGSINKRVILFSDITKKKESDELLWTQANFDALTGLPNRNLFRDHLRQEIRKARRNNTPLALMFLDLDGFKDVNDTMGHDMGDLLLKQAAERLQSAVRATDIVARLGGDEFTVILAELNDAADVKRVARNILKKLSQPFLLGEEIAHVSGSIGITLFPADAIEIEDLLKNADQAMYAAKQRGRNQYQYFTQSMQDAAQARMRLVNDMRSALDSDQFEVVYQPIIELASGVIRKAEALIRWQHPTRGMINPAEFIPAAEDTGMINAFGDWVFHQAASQAAKWREKYHPDFQISVNISPVQFKKEGIDSTVWFEHLKNLSLPAQGIVVEITEGLLLEASSSVTDQLLALRDAGIEVALDDFGVGYSSLSYLKKFDIDYLKIDQAFVRNLAPGSSDMALCEAIIVMAHKLGLKVIAEGVENKDQRDLLAGAECDYVQGYLYSGPLSAQGIENLLKSGPFASMHAN